MRRICFFRLCRKLRSPRSTILCAIESTFRIDLSFFLQVDNASRCARITPSHTEDRNLVASSQMRTVISQTDFPKLKIRGRGKVRDIYELGDRLLIVATDRLSAFDVVLPTPIPDKGRVLTQLSLFWFDLLKDVIPNHVIRAAEFPAPFDRFREELAGRSMLAQKTK